MRINVSEHGLKAATCKAYLDDRELVSCCVEVDPIEGYVLVYLLDDKGLLLLDDHMKPILVRKTGAVRIERVE